VLGDDLVVLRPWRDDDVEAVFRACQDPDIQYFTQVPVPYLRQHAQGFVAAAAEQWEDATGAQFAVTDRISGELLSCMGLMEADWPARQIAAGYWTAPWARSRGVTRRALGVATQWALSDGGFERVVLEVEQANPRSAAVALATGYFPTDDPIDSWELKGVLRHFVHYAITRPTAH
jgi:RimJ/RimL family protein N-acetyltransferase